MWRWLLSTDLCSGVSHVQNSHPISKLVWKINEYFLYITCWNDNIIGMVGKIKSIIKIILTYFLPSFPRNCRIVSESTCDWPYIPTALPCSMLGNWVGTDVSEWVEPLAWQKGQAWNRESYTISAGSVQATLQSWIPSHLDLCSSLWLLLWV